MLRNPQNNITGICSQSFKKMNQGVLLFFAELTDIFQQSSLRVGQGKSVVFGGKKLRESYSESCTDFFE